MEPVVTSLGRPALAALVLGLEPRAGQPLHRQLYVQLREAILDGRLETGSRLPSSRALAASLGIARNTALAAVEQLVAEGYVTARRASGVYVSATLPDSTIEASPSVATKANAVEKPAPPTRYGALHPAFIHSLPDVAAFPADAWGRLVARTWRRPDAALLTARDPLGHRPLREAIARYLRAVRAVDAGPDQVIVTAGAQQGLDLAARVLARPGQGVWVEDPGYAGTRAAFAAAGGRVVAVAVDDEGLSVAAGRAAAPDAALAVVTPSHQFPLGVTMSLARRLELLEWAAAQGAWIVEDDYDSEYRFAGRPLAALQGLDRAGRVVYVGTFAKVLFPALRVGYVIAPSALVERFAQARAAVDGHPPIGFQPALAEFIESGAFTSHIRRTRQLYGARRSALLDALERHLAGVLRPRPSVGGMHVVATFADGAVDDRIISRLAEERGLSVQPLSAYYAGRDRARRGLLLGHAAVPDAMIEPATRALAEALAPRGAARARAGSGGRG